MCNHNVTQYNQNFVRAINNIRDWFFESSGYYLNVHFIFKDYSDHPLTTRTYNVATGQDYIVKKEIAVDEKHISSMGALYEKETGEQVDIVCLAYNPEKLPNPKPAQSLHNAVLAENFTTLQVRIDSRSEMFYMQLIMIHEMMHALIFLINHRGGYSIQDTVHSYSSFDDPRPQNNFKTLLRQLEPYWPYLSEESNMQPDKDITKLNPVFRLLVETLITRCQFGQWKAFVTEGYRSPERQNWLYQQGRTRPGSIVTYAKAGESDHNYGLAVDIAFKNWYGKVSYDPGLFSQAATIAKDLGLSWGGDWSKFQDMPHFYITKKDMANLQKKTLSKYEGKVIYPGPDQNGKKHYLVRNGRLEWIENELDFFITGYDFSDAIPVDPSLVAVSEQTEFSFDPNDKRVQQAKNLVHFTLRNAGRAKDMFEKRFGRL